MRVNKNKEEIENGRKETLTWEQKERNNRIQKMYATENNKNYQIVK